MRLGEATIGPGIVSADVKEVQMILTGQGYNVGPIDGNFGPQTLTAVQAFQRTKGLVPDGIIGPQTWGALRGQSVAQPITPTVPPPSPMKPESKPRGFMGGNIPMLALGLVGLGLAFLISRR